MEVGWGGDEGVIRMGMKMEGKEGRWGRSGDGLEMGMGRRWVW